MAETSISMKKFVDITTRAPGDVARDRDMGLRVITNSKKIDGDKLETCTSAAQVRNLFGIGSAEDIVASNYFSYISLSGTKARKITFWRKRPEGQIEVKPGNEIGITEGYCQVSEIPAEGSCVIRKYGKETKEGEEVDVDTLDETSLADWRELRDTLTWDEEAGAYKTTDNKLHYAFVRAIPGELVSVKVVSCVDFVNDVVKPLASSISHQSDGSWEVSGGNSWFVEFLPEDDLVSSLDKMVQRDDDFGTFFSVPALSILNTDNPETQGWGDSANAVSKWVEEHNNRFRFVQRVELGRIAERDNNRWVKLPVAEDYLNRIRRPGTHMVLSDTAEGEATKYPEYISCAILAATRYLQPNSTLIQEFKAVNNSNLRVTVRDDSLFEILTGLFVNFYGLTQKAGQTYAFYMEGFNADGTDTAVYDNEMWLKDRIETRVFNRFLTCNKLPVGPIGRAMVAGAIKEVISDALTNLSVVPEKPLGDDDRAAIIANTGATDAPSKIFTDGYYLKVVDGDPDEARSTKHRRIEYVLYYATGEGVRKVEGSHVLV